MKLTVAFWADQSAVAVESALHGIVLAADQLEAGSGTDVDAVPVTSTDDDAVLRQLYRVDGARVVVRHPAVSGPTDV